MNKNFKIINDLEKRILVLDGSMGVLIQGYGLSENDFRGDIKKDSKILLKGNNDFLNLTKPDFIKDIYKRYLKAGSDIIETNTFNASIISQREYETDDLVYQINKKSAELANEAIDDLNLNRSKLFIAGSIGPTSKTLSLSPNPSDPAFREVTFDEMKDSYKEQIKGLVDGKVDLLLIETIFDSLVARSAVIAANEVFMEKGIIMPIMISATIIDKSGRLLSGQTLEAFLHSIENENIISFGLNCSFGAKELIPYIIELSKKTELYISIHPNAGLPNTLGDYDETPEITGSYVEQLVKEEVINIVGGCCGTTPEHIKAIKNIVQGRIPRKIKKVEKHSVYCGLEPVFLKKENNFLNIGERNNVAGSKKFARLISEKKYEEALEIARDQVDNGALVIDINFDDAMLDSKVEMEYFLKLISSEPDISKVPIMIDSSKWEVLEVGLKSIQGKPIVNSISLKEGEEEFLNRAKVIKSFGAAVVVMAFDENGQADSYNRKINICKRAYDILVKEINFNPLDIIFDPNILTIATGIEEHDNYGVDFIESVKWIKANLPGAKVSGGISNLSFSFRGNKPVREAIHSVFLYHAINAGLDMGILNPGMIKIYEDIPKDFLGIVENVVLNKDKKSQTLLLEYATDMIEDNKSKDRIKKDQWREYSVEDRLKYSIVKGITNYLEKDLDEIREKIPSALVIIETVLMKGMNKVGELFGDGKMFLPQVIKSARVMKNAVEILKPHIEKEIKAKSDNKKSKILMATVKGDVHDIGKNITGLVLSCNGFEIIDLGIMIPTEEIIEKAMEYDVELIGVSGLITPSLEEMSYLAQKLEENNFDLPLLIGGAATSKMHTAIKIETNYKGKTVYVKDASKSVDVCKSLTNPKLKGEYLANIENEYKEVRENYNKIERKFLSISKAREKKAKIDFSNIEKPDFIGTKILNDYPIREVRDFIDWTFFFVAFEMNKKFPDILNDAKYGEEAKKLYKEANELLDYLEKNKLITLNGVFGIYPANSHEDDIIVYNNEKREKEITRFNMLRFQEERKNSECLSIADFIAPLDEGKIDYIGGFAMTAGIGVEDLVEDYERKGDSFNAILVKILADRLAEAFAEKVHQLVRKEFWAYDKTEDIDINEILKEKYMGIRPAIGYPSIPDHSEKEKLNILLDFENVINAKLTSSFMMEPGASVCGLYISNKEAKYFDVGKIMDDQIIDYSKRKNIDVKVLKKLLNDRTYTN
ncbi:MAG: methionine synthase [Clostridiales bacterium]